MFSILKPDFLYDDVSPDVVEHDENVESDVWNIDGNQVYRGAQDPRYTHAHVFWLYNEDLERVGCCEHDLHNRAKYHALWFRESPFGTLLQEDGWETHTDIWSKMAENVFDKFVNEGWTTPYKFLEQCLKGPTRIMTVDMIVKPPAVFTCKKCGLKSLHQHEHHEMKKGQLDVVDFSKLFFVDSDMIIHLPPPDSRIYNILIRPVDDDSLTLVLEEELEESLEEEGSQDE